MAFSYELTYGGIPFLADDATPYRMPYKGQAEGEDPDHSPARRQQPLSDLVDELDRLFIDFRLLNDFDSASDYPGRALGGVARPANAQAHPNAALPLNCLYWPTSAARFAAFRGLATTSMVRDMADAARGWRAKPFVMKCLPHGGVRPDATEGQYTVTTDLFMLPPRPLAVHGSQFEGLFLVTLVDQRYFWAGDHTSLTVTQDSTWAGLIDQVASDLGISVDYGTISPAYGQPEPDSPLWTRDQPAAALLDALAYNVGKVVVRLLDGTVKMVGAKESYWSALADRGDASQLARTAGGDIFNSGDQALANTARNATLPQNVRVSFPYYVQGDGPVPHLLNSRYRPQRPSAWFEDGYGGSYALDVPLLSGGLQGVASGDLHLPVSGALASGTPGQYASGTLVSGGLVGYSETTLRGTAKALTSGENQSAPLNLSGLTALAVQAVTDLCHWRAGAALDEVYPGTYAWTPEGFHDLVWQYSARRRQAVLRVMRTLWDPEITEYQWATPALSGYSNTPRGVGGPSVAQTWRDGATSGGRAQLGADFLSGATTTALNGRASGLPQGQRWRGVVNSGQSDEEVVLFEGMSGGLTATAVYRAIDGSLPHDHASGAWVDELVPHAVYGANLVTGLSGIRVYPGQWTSGGIQEVLVDSRTVINSGDINSGNLSAIDWTVNYFPLVSGASSGNATINFNGFFSLRPTFVSVFGGGVYTLTDSDVKLGFSLTGDVTVNGFAGGVHGRILYLWNVGTGKVVLANEAAGANSIFTPLQKDYTLWPRDGCIIEYDATLPGWRFDVPTVAASSGIVTAANIEVYAARHFRFMSGVEMTHAGAGHVNVYANLYGASGNCGGINWSGYVVTDVTCSGGTLVVSKSIFTFTCGLLTSVV